MRDRQKRLAKAVPFIFVVDPEQVVCDALAMLFQLEGFRWACSTNLVELYATLRKRRPDAIVMNARVGGDGLATLRRIKEVPTAPPVFVLIDQPSTELEQSAIAAGAADVIAKPIDIERLAGGVLRALAARAATIEVPHRTDDLRLPKLSPRENEIVQRIASGRTSREVAEELEISPRTVEVHRAKILHKLGAKNTAELVRIVIGR